MLYESVSELIHTFLDSLEIYHGKVFVTHVFGLLAASKYLFLSLDNKQFSLLTNKRYGLSVDELIDMLSSVDNVLTAVSIYVLYTVKLLIPQDISISPSTPTKGTSLFDSTPNYGLWRIHG